MNQCIHSDNKVTILKSKIAPFIKIFIYNNVLT